MICPCKVCADRAIGCHGKCEKYKEWRQMFESERKARLKKMEAIDFLDRSAVRGLRRTKYYNWKRK